MTPNRKQNRKQRRAAKNVLVAHLVLLDFYPVRPTCIAKRGGPCFYVDGQGFIQHEIMHGYQEPECTAWPGLSTLRALARKAGVWN